MLLAALPVALVLLAAGKHIHPVALRSGGKTAASACVAGSCGAGSHAAGHMLLRRRRPAAACDLAGGARFPAKLLRALQRCKDDPEGLARVGIHYASEQCLDLLENEVRGIHFYTLNRSDATRQIYASLGLKHSRIGPA